MIVKWDFRKMAVLCDWAWKNYEFLEVATTKFPFVKIEKTTNMKGVVFHI